MWTAGKLNDVRVRAASVGTHGDGGGLYLAVKQGTAGLNRSWLFRYSIGGRSHWTGLGAYPDISLQRARQKAQECRQQLYDGVDPLQRKRDERAALRQRYTKHTPTFAECATAYIASHEAGWRGKRTGQLWVRTLRDYAFPVMGRLSVDEIITDNVLTVLKPLWRTKPETATHVRGRIEQVLDSAKALGHRSGENPARWRGHLDHLLPARAKVAPVQHHPALPYRECRHSWMRCGSGKARQPKCLEFTILCACRSAGRRSAPSGARSIGKCALGPFRRREQNRPVSTGYPLASPLSDCCGHCPARVIMCFRVGLAARRATER
jgi:hypothetical protein